MPFPDLPPPPTDLPLLEGGEDVGPKMTLMEHLLELRNRLIKIVLSLVIATTLSFIFVDYLIDVLTQPIGGRQNLVAIEVTENFGVFMRVSLLSGAIIAMPIMVYQVLRFVVPGLTPRERRYLWIVLPGTTVLFLAGACFAYFIMLPVALPFLTSFLGIKTEVRPSNYFNFLTRLMFWIGLSFETPLLMAFLARVGVLSPQTLASKRKYAIVANAVLAAVITPTIDPLNMMLVMVPLCVLYEIGVLLARMVYRPRYKASTAST